MAAVTRCVLAPVFQLFRRPALLLCTPCPGSDSTKQKPERTIELRFMAKASKSKKYVYNWGNKKADGDGSMKPLLGGKGANLAEMTRIGLPVPPGFTITTE